MSTSMVRISTTPWTKEQVEALSRRQEDAAFHPYTCDRHPTLPLVPTKTGWRCLEPRCAYQQSWAHAADVTP